MIHIFTHIFSTNMQWLSSHIDCDKSTRFVVKSFNLFSIHRFGIRHENWGWMMCKRWCWSFFSKENKFWTWRTCKRYMDRMDWYMHLMLAAYIARLAQAIRSLSLFFHCDTAVVLTLTAHLSHNRFVLLAVSLFTECYSRFIECVLVYFHIIISEIRYMIWCRKQARALAFSHRIAGGCVLYKFIFSFAFFHSTVSFRFCHRAVSIQYTHTPRIELDSVGFFKRTVSHLSVFLECWLNAFKRIKSNCTNIIYDKVKRSQNECSENPKSK